MRSIVLAGALAACAACTSKPDPHAGHTASAPASSDAASAAAVHVNPLVAPGPAPAGMVWVPGGTFWMGCENCGMPDALPVHLVAVDGFWMDRTPVTNAEFERFVQRHRIRHGGRAAARSERLSWRAARQAGAGLRRVHADVDAGAARQSSAVVALHAGRELEASGRPGQQREGARGSSCCARRLRGRDRVREVGREASADGSRVRVRRARRPRSTDVPVGQRDEPGRQGGGEYLAGTVPGERPGRGRLSRHVAGDRVSVERIRTLRHGRQRVAVVPPTGTGPTPTRPGHSPARSLAIRRGPPTASTRRSRALPNECCAADRISARIRYCARYLVGSRGKSEISSGTSNLGFRLAQTR